MSQAKMLFLSLTLTHTLLFSAFAQTTTTTTTTKTTTKTATTTTTKAPTPEPVPAVAVKPVKKDTSVPLRGEHIDGRGYKLYFDENQNAFLSLSGYMRLYANASKSNKLNLRNFRFYFDGQSNERWSFHTRLDYSKNFVNSADKTSPGVQFSRAYGTYKFSDELSLDFGRTINQIYDYDVLVTPDIVVGPGIVATYRSGDLTLKGTFHIMDDSEAMFATETTEQERMVAGLAATKVTKLRAGELTVSLAGTVNSNHNDKYNGPNLTQIMPAIFFNLPDDTYFLSQSVVKFYNREKNKNIMKGAALAKDTSPDDSIESYFEVGTPLNSAVTVDVNYTLTKAGDYDIVDFNNQLGCEFIYTPTKSVTFLLSLTHEHLETKPEDSSDFWKRFGHTAYVQYSF